MYKEQQGKSEVPIFTMKIVNLDIIAYIQWPCPHCSYSKTVTKMIHIIFFVRFGHKK